MAAASTTPATAPTGSRGGGRLVGSAGDSAVTDGSVEPATGMRGESDGDLLGTAVTRVAGALGLADRPPAGVVSVGARVADGRAPDGTGDRLGTGLGARLACGVGLAAGRHTDE